MAQNNTFCLLTVDQCFYAKKDTDKNGKILHKLILIVAVATLTSPREMYVTKLQFSSI